MIGRSYLRGEVEVALVVRRAAEDGAGAVVHQHEIGDVDRQRLAVAEGMGDREAGVVAHLLGGLDRLGAGAAAVALRDEGGEPGVLGGERARQRMVGRERDEARAEQRVGAGGEDLDRLEAGRRRAG